MNVRAISAFVIPASLLIRPESSVPPSAVRIVEEEIAQRQMFVHVITVMSLVVVETDSVFQSARKVVSLANVQRPRYAHAGLDTCYKAKTAHPFAKGLNYSYAENGVFKRGIITLVFFFVKF